MEQQKQFDLQELRRVELKDFFHPQFLAHCGFIERPKSHHTSAWYRLQRTVFLKTQESADALIALCEKVWKREKDDETESDRKRMHEVWNTELQKYLEQHALKTVGELANKDSLVFGLHWDSEWRDWPPTIRPLGTTSLRNIDAVLQYFGLETPMPRGEYEKEVEAAKVLAIAKRVIQTPQ